MNPPVELQNLDPLNSVSFGIFFNNLIKAIYASTAGQDWGEVFRNFWLLLPDYAVSFMLRLFSFSFILSLLLIAVIIWSANNLIRIRRQMHEAIALPGKKVTKGNEIPAPMVN